MTVEMSRSEHLKWAKSVAAKAAEETTDMGRILNVFIDALNQHPELKHHRALSEITLLMMFGVIKSRQQLLGALDEFVL